MANNTQIINFNYGQSLTPDVMNKLFYNLFDPGVIEATFSFTANTLTVISSSFLISPQNLTNTIVRIDATASVTYTKKSPTNNYFIARYRWENENTGAEFLFADDSTITDTDIILIGLVLDENGKIIDLNYDVQDRAALKVIQTNTSFPLVTNIDGYAPGHESGCVPISDGELNYGLNAEMLGGKKVTDLVVSKEEPIYVYEGELEQTILDNIIFPTYPDWMDVDSVNIGEGVTSEFLDSYKIQPQDGTTKPENTNQIPVSNGILQKGLDAEMLDGHYQEEFSKTTHTHTLDEILDEAPYYAILGVENNLITSESIAEDEIDYTAVGRIVFDPTIGNYHYQPIYETGVITLTQYAETTVTFERTIKNARIILQRVPAMEVVYEGAEKRTARLTEVTETGFKAKQMGSIVLDGSTINYIRNDALDAAANQYYYFVIGEKA